MFDKYSIGAGPSTINANVKVTEHRAPTDESVRLLRDMENAARSKIVDSFRLDNNDFNCAVSFYDGDYFHEVVFIVDLKVNGTTLRAEARISRDDEYDEEKIIAAVVSAVAPVITNHILRPTLGPVLAKRSKFAYFRGEK